MKGTAYWSGEGSFDATWSIIDVYYFQFTGLLLIFKAFAHKIEFVEIYLKINVINEYYQSHLIDYNKLPWIELF